MPTTEIRDLDPGDLDAALRVRALSFGHMGAGAEPGWRERHTKQIEDRRVLGAYVDGRLAGMARANDFRQWWHGRDLPMGGVAGVVIAPEHRGHGVGRALVGGLLQRMRELGYPLSALYPATVPPYRSLGWELAGRQYSVSIAGDKLRTLARSIDPVPLRPLTAAELPAAIDVLDAQHREHRDVGPLRRELSSWVGHLAEGADAAYLAADGLVEYDWSGAGTLHVSRLSAASAETTRALWAVVGSGASIAHTVTANLAPDDPLPWLLPDLGVTPAPEHWWMLRLLDPAAAFAGRGYPLHAAVEASFTLTDPQLPQLDGGWLLSVGEESGSFVQAGAAAASYEIGPRGLAALFAGTRLSVLRRAGLVGGGTGALDAALDACFAGTPFLLDYF